MNRYKFSEIKKMDVGQLWSHKEKRQSIVIEKSLNENRWMVTLKKYLEKPEKLKMHWQQISEEYYLAKK